MPAQPSTIASALVFGQRAQKSRPRSCGGPPNLLFERQHRNVGGAHPGAARREAVFGEVPLDRRDRAGRVVTTLNFSAIRLARWNAASPMPTTGAIGCAARGVQPGVVETGDDEGVGVGRPGDLGERSGHGEGFVEIALDARRPEFGIDGA